MSITGTSPAAAVLGFRLFAIASAFGFAGITFLAAKRLTNDRRLQTAAMVVVLWQPVLLFESATGAHNDALIMLLALGGLLCITSGRRGGIRGGLVVITLSALLKYVTLPLVVFAALWRLREIKQGTPFRQVVKEWAIDGVAVAAIIVVSFVPYWGGYRTLHSLLQQPMRGVSGSLWQIPHAIVNGHSSHHTTARIEDILGYVTLVGLIPIFLITLQRLAHAMLTGKSERFFLASQFAAWAVAGFVLATIPIDTHAWYVIWAIAPVALAFVAWQEGLFKNPADGDEDSPTIDHQLRVPIWFMLYLVWDFCNLLIYHTRVVG